MQHDSPWNDERVELLKKLWAEGLSASQIAGRIGSVTRNAVIAKVHRLRVSGLISKDRPPSLTSPRAGGVPALTGRHATLSPKRRKKPTHGVLGIAGTIFAGKAKNGPPSSEPTAPYVERPPSYMPPTEQLVRSIADLEPRHCRWPIGEPRTPEFAFCGGRRVVAARYPYCERHQAMAVQAPEKGSATRPGGRIEIAPPVGATDLVPADDGASEPDLEDA